MSDHNQDALDDLQRLCRALAPAHEHLVLVGGWVPALYRSLDWTGTAFTEPIKTGDIDCASPVRLPGDCPPILPMLQAGGFRALFNRAGDHRPPITRYQHERWGEAPGRVYAEFLAPLRGKATRQDGSPRATTAPQAGLSAQLLRYMDLALHEPISMDLSQLPGADGGSTPIRIPHPGNFLVHKALVAELRSKPEKRDKDWAYFFDVAVICRPGWNEVAARVDAIEADNGEWARWVSRARGLATAAFANKHARGCAGVVRVLRDAHPSAAPSALQVAEVMRLALPAMHLG